MKTGGFAMKTNWIKYIFFTLIIVLIGIGVYFLYENQEERQSAVRAMRNESNIITKINIGISGYDTINPILSKSRDVQYLSKLIYRSLLRVTPDFRIENDIAAEWSRVNSTTYLIRLQENIRMA